MSLTRIAVFRPVVALTVTLALVLFGIVSYLNLGLEQNPALNLPIVTVQVTYPGASARSVEEQVARRIEDAIAGLGNIKTITSVSRNSLATVTVEFNEGVDVDTAASDVERRVSGVRRDLPAEAEEPSFVKLDLNDVPVLYLSITSAAGDAVQLFRVAAGIEAARAGEHGRGFAVVADEVRKLAERSRRETRAISTLIAHVQTSTRDAVSAMEAGSARVEQGAQKADQAGTALGEILTAVGTTVGEVGGIAAAAQKLSAEARSVVDAMHSISAVVEESSAASEQMAAQADQVNGAIQSIAAVSEENSAITEEVSASTEEMTAQVEEMTSQLQELAHTAADLRELVARFQLEDAILEDVPEVVTRRRTADWAGGGRPRHFSVR